MTDIKKPATRAILFCGFNDQDIQNRTIAFKKATEEVSVKPQAVYKASVHSEQRLCVGSEGTSIIPRDKKSESQTVLVAEFIEASTSPSRGYPKDNAMNFCSTLINLLPKVGGLNPVSAMQVVTFDGITQTPDAETLLASGEFEELDLDDIA